MISGLKGNVNSCSINARHRLIQFKILHRLHYSKTRLHRIFPETSPICDKCQCAEADLLHSFWASVFFFFFPKLFDVQLDPDPILILIGLSGQSKKLKSTQIPLLVYGLMCAKRLILLLWKGKELPSLKAWISVLTDTLHLERIRYIINDKLEDFDQIWRPLIEHLEIMNK